MSATAISYFEREGRAAKVARLVLAIDREFAGEDRKFDPYRFADKIAAELEGWAPKRWNQLAARNGIRNPSPKTRPQVIARYRARAVEYLSGEELEPEELAS